MSPDPRLTIEGNVAAGRDAPQAAPLAVSAPGRRLRHLVLLLIVGTLWGIQPALIKVSTDRGLSEAEALSIVLLCVSGMVGAYLAATGRLFRTSRQRLKFFATAGVLEYAAPLLIAFLVAPHIDSALLTLIMSTTPIFTVPLAAAAGSEPMTRGTVLATLVGLAAMALLVVPQDALPSRDMLPWCAIAFLVPAFYSCGSVYVSRAWPEGLNAIQVAFGGSLFAALLLSPFSIQAALTGALADNTAAGFAAFAALAISVVVEMVLYFYLVKHAGPVFTSFSSFVMIMSGFAVGIHVFGERPTVWIISSMAMFVLSLLLVLTSAPDPEATHSP